MDTNNTSINNQPNSRSKSMWSCLGLGAILLLILLCALASTGIYLYLNNESRILDIERLFNRTQNNKQSSGNNTQNINNVISGQVFEAKGDIVNIVDKSSPAIVTVVVKSPQNNRNNLDLDERRTIGSGTGFFITNDGTLITNEHVVCGARAEDLLIVTSDQKNYTVSAVSVDSAQDVAIIRVKIGNDKVSSLKFANPESRLRPGQQVIAIGNPFGNNPGSVTTGIISGIDRNISATGSCGGALNETKDYEGVIQTDAAINSGNSGGPLLNMNGEVIGVNSATLRGANNISYTVPYTTVLKILDRYYKNNNQIISPFIGVTHQIIDPSESRAVNLPAGAVVLSVQSGSPADKAGVKQGDVITKIGDKEVNFSLVATLNQYFEPGQKTTLTVFRPSENDRLKGQTLTLEITIGTRPASF